MTPQEKTLILGLGNPILTDDAIGWHVARRVFESIGDENYELAEAAVAGLGILDLIAGYDKVIIVDAIQTKRGRVGDVYALTLDDLRLTPRLTSPHDVDFTLAFRLGQALDVPLPRKIKIYAVEVADPYSFGEELTALLQKAVNTIVQEESRPC
ncbi:MAG: hydrogenase maturation protease [Chloroflexi bacterium]|nr:hydrogenase maturation protease [Chloroflexota bacterium]